MDTKNFFRNHYSDLKSWFEKDRSDKGSGNSAMLVLTTVSRQFFRYIIIYLDPPNEQLRVYEVICQCVW